MRSAHRRSQRPAKPVLQGGYAVFFLQELADRCVHDLCLPQPVCCRTPVGRWPGSAGIVRGPPHILAEEARRDGPAVLKQGARFQAGRRSRNGDPAAKGRWSKHRAIRAWSCCPPGRGHRWMAGSPCYRLCLNGGRLQPEPICKFGRKSLDLKTSVGFCDENPFPGKTIHRRADNVIPDSGACENRARRRNFPFTSVSILFQLRGMFILVNYRAYSHSSIRVSLWGGHAVGSVARPGDGSNSMRGARPVRQWGPHRTTDNRGTTLSWSMVG